MIVAGLQSSSGKTSVTCLLLATLKQRGVPVQPFKVGPDFIDPAYHTRVSETPSRNLDPWLMGRETMREELREHGSGRVSIIEGVMGLFDGAAPDSDKESTIELARSLDWPILLVVPAQQAGRSLAVILQAMLEHIGRQRVIGVVLNRVRSASHAGYLRRAMKACDVPVCGALPFADPIAWDERHLGLQAVQENGVCDETTLAELAAEHLDLETLLSALQPAPANGASKPPAKRRRRIAIAQDEAFHFYYVSNLDYLKENGVELVAFSTLDDDQLPSNIDGLLFGGGFPESFARQLGANTRLRCAIYDAIHSGMPCYAECGGMIYLADHLRLRNGDDYPMCGVIPGTIEITDRLHHFGYCACGPLEGGAAYHGHEFHYSRWVSEEGQANLWRVEKRQGGQKRLEGYGLPNLHASYVHLFFRSSPEIVTRLFNLAGNEETKKTNVC